MLGKKSIFAEEARQGSFIGAGWLPEINLTNHLPGDRTQFNKEYIPVYLEKHPTSSKIAASQACGMLFTISKGILTGDIVLCPDGTGNYFVGEITGDYSYTPGANLPHRRSVRWFSRTIARSELSQALQNSTGSIGTVSTVTKYAQEIESLIAGAVPPSIVTTDETIEDPSIFALEKHLEDFLVQNWRHTELGKHYDIFEEDGELVGQQYQSDTGSIDILAVSKDKQRLLVVELKKGRASDVVVGQIQRYMGFVKDELAEPNQTVHGAIIAFEDDLKIHRALSVAHNIDFYTYKINFMLQKK